MNITLQNIGRRYNKEWIFRHLDYTFSFGKKYAILGPNGSGKSTLLKVLSGSLSPSEGTIVYSDADKATIAVEDVYRYLTIAAPYVELLEELSLREMLNFHFKFKDYLPGYDLDRVLELLALPKAVDKELRFFSSGMKQRVKLVLSCCANSPIVLLDEPTSNLDSAAELWYTDLIAETMHPDRLLLIGSNQEKEYAFCDEQVHVLSYK